MVISQDLLNSLKTTKDVQDFILRIDTLIDLIYETDSNNENDIEQVLPPDQKTVVNHMANNNQVSINDTSAFEDFLITLRHDLKEIPVLEITLGVELPTKSINNISSWIKDNFGPSLVLSITIDPDIIGGVVINHGGKIIDFSLKEQLNQIYLDYYQNITTAAN